MKKNISINISGIIFHIEEDVFETLKKYLDSIHEYFSNFDDSKEIIDDIESRIAEIFLAKLSEGNQVITGEMIADLQKTMGTVSDFQAAFAPEEDQESATTAKSNTNQTNQKENTDQKTDSAPKRLYRNNQHRVFGGVASGMAEYFNIDPIWIRLILLGLFFNLILPTVSGFIFIAYIILWIILPVNPSTEDSTGIKKLYRDSDDRVLGGVAGGLSAFFGIDAILVRLIFILSIFAGGAGIILYIIMWIITPEAKTITEKMQMQGEPVTLSNIENNVKKTLNMDKKEENLMIKIILFPFRLISMVLSGISKMLGPLLKVIVDVFRILFGLLIVIIGLSLLFSLVVLILVVLGISSFIDTPFFIQGFPAEIFIDSFTTPALISAFIVTFIPVLVLTLAGLMVIAKRKIGNAAFGWSLFGIWLIGMIGVAFFGPRTIQEFRFSGNHTEERIYPVETGTVPTLQLADDFLYQSYEAVELRLRGHEDTTFNLVLDIKSRGSSRAEARKNAADIGYDVVYENGDFYFSNKMDFSDAKFRFQEIKATLYIPYGQVFKMDENLGEILINTLHLHGYRARQMDGNEWVYDASGLNCLTCDQTYNRRSTDSDTRSYSSSRQDDWESIRGESMTYAFDGFSKLEISDFFNVYIREGDTYSVELKGKNLEDAYLNQSGNKLKVYSKRKIDLFSRKNNRMQRTNMLVTLPDLEEVNLSGASTGTVTGFENDMEISLSGASDLTMDTRARDLKVMLSGASKLQIKGNTQMLDARVSGASTLEAFDLKASQTYVDISGASRARVVGVDKLEVEASGLSNVSYKNSSNVSVEADQMSTVRKVE